MRFQINRDSIPKPTPAPSLCPINTRGSSRPIPPNPKARSHLKPMPSLFQSRRGQGRSSLIPTPIAPEPRPTRRSAAKHRSSARSPSSPWTSRTSNSAKNQTPLPHVRLTSPTTPATSRAATRRCRLPCRRLPHLCCPECEAEYYQSLDSNNF